MKLAAFKDLVFYHCYDCGWGEKGVYATYLSYDEAYEIIKDRSCQEAADKFAEYEDDYFDFAVDQYMISKRAFVEADWEGSQDY